jgi:S-DNA-T family DNA segregation ATPase FtsK/SpoIIIE
MSKNKKEDAKKEKRDKKENARGNNSKLQKDTKYAIWGIILSCLAVVFFLSLLGGAGVAGRGLYRVFSYLFGIGYVLLPIFLFLLAITFFRTKTVSVFSRHGIGAVIFLFASLGLIGSASTNSYPGGVVGFIIAAPFVTYLGPVAGVLVLGALLIISILVLFNSRPDLSRVKESMAEKVGGIGSMFQKKNKDGEYGDEFVTGTYDGAEVPVMISGIPTDTAESPKEVMPPKQESKDEFVPEIPKRKKYTGAYTFPPLSLLERDRGKPNTGDIKANANIIKRTLQNFGIEVEMDEITVGPTVTRYALKPAEGVKLSRIVALQQDLALALAAHPIRVEAPIPGKSLVGIEIPNRAKSIIGLATLLEDKEFSGSHVPLLIGLGKNVSGRPLFANISKMPHCLIAGATGSGKSVTIHALITSLLYRNSPEELRFIMVDPKRVELTLYNGIPHLLTPVITDPKKTILALKWAAKEMERRYDILESSKVRDVSSYHQNIIAKYKGADDAEDAPDKMPYIIVIIDELADIMQTYPRELEAGIVRLAQMSRAVGIHLVLSTQRPSVNVITGLIKANIPARVALQVASQIDSRTILDQPGAEKLLGAGDMLFSSGEMSSPERIQCPYISEEEVKNVVSFIKSHSEIAGEELDLSNKNVVAPDNAIFSASLEENDADDDLYEEARQVVIENQKASTSFLQRKLGVGYARAARLIDMLEERGVVGVGNGAKPRDVLEKSVGSESQGYSG